MMRRNRWITATALIFTMDFGGLSRTLSAEETEVDFDAWQTQSQAVTGPPGTPPSLISTDRFVSQGAASDRVKLTEGVTLGGTAWASWDTLPSQNPQVLPDDKGLVSSRLLEGSLIWTPFPGQLIFEAGKTLLRPSSGFFRTPLDTVVHPVLEPSLDGSAVGTWEEGYWGASGQTLWDGGSFSLWLSPKLTWAEQTDKVLKYLTSDQNLWRGQARWGWKIGDADVQLLTEAETPGAKVSDPLNVVRPGAGVDAALNDAWTFKVEGRVDLSPDTAITGEGLIGFGWSSGERVSVTVEAASDETGRHGFFRWAFPVDDKVDAVAWVEPSLEDLSGVAGGDLEARFDQWGWSVWAQLPWGEAGTEQGNSPWLGSWGARATLYF